jgi:hypothetical protein
MARTARLVRKGTSAGRMTILTVEPDPWSAGMPSDVNLEPTYATPYNTGYWDATPDLSDNWKIPEPDRDHPQRSSMYQPPGTAMPFEVWEPWQPELQYKLGLKGYNPVLEQVAQNYNSAGGRLGGLLPNPLGNRGNLPRGTPIDTMEGEQPGYGIGGWF